MPAQKVAQALNRPTKGIKGTVPHPASSPRRRRVDRLGRKKAIPVAKAIFTSSDRKMVESTPGTSPLPDPQKVVEDLDFSLEDPQTTAKPISSPLRAVSAKKNFAAKKRKAQPNPDSSYRDEEDDHVKLLIRRRAAVERGIGRSSRNKSSPQTLPVAPIIDDQPLENTEANILDPSHHLSTRVIDFAKIAQEKIQQADFLKVLSQQREEAKRQMIAEFDDNDITLVDHDECTDQSERDEPEDLTTTLLSRLLTSAASHTTDAQITPQAPVAPIEAFERREDTSVRQRRRLSIDVGGNLAQPSKLAPGIGLTRPRVVNVVRDVFGPKDRREVLSKPPPVFRVPQPRTGRVPFEPLTNSESNVPIRKKQVPLIRAKQPELAPQKISSHVSPPVIHVPSTPQYPVRAVSGSRETVRRAGDEPQPHRRLQSIQRPSPARERSRGGLPTFEPASLIGRFDGEKADHKVMNLKLIVTFQRR